MDPFDGLNFKSNVFKYLQHRQFYLILCSVVLIYQFWGQLKVCDAAEYHAASLPEAFSL